MTDWWHTKSLDELNTEEWELLCDGCAKCCLHKLEHEDDGTLLYTRVHCRLLDADKCRCTDYSKRMVKVPSCMNLRGQDVAALKWLPASCAYRLRAAGEPLPSWHPLVSGDPDAVHRAGASVRGRVVSEEFVHPDGYDEHIVHWVD